MNRKYITTLALALLAIAGAGLGGALAPQDDLALDAENATTTPGNTATVTVTVENTGNETVGGNYTLGVNASALPEGWQVTVSNTTVVHGSLASNATRTANVSVTVPQNASTGAHQLTLALSSGNQTWATTTATVRVNGIPETTTQDSGPEDRDEDDSDDERAMDTTEENDSEGGPAVGVFPRESPSTAERIWMFFQSSIGRISAAVVFAAIGLAVYSRRP